MAKSRDVRRQEPSKFDNTRSGLEWFDLRALSKYAAVSERTIRAWIHRASDPLPAYQIAKKILIKRAEFDAWIKGHIIGSGELEVGRIVDEIVEQVASSD